MAKKKSAPSKRFERLSSIVTKKTGSSTAFMIAVGTVLVWLALGPVFDYSDTWQLVINTGTTIITFLMVFLIQRSQNKESMAVQLKLNELIASSRLASNRLIDVEDLTEEELKVLGRFYVKLATLSKTDKSMHQSHSIEEAEDFHKKKMRLKGDI